MSSIDCRESRIQITAAQARVREISFKVNSIIKKKKLLLNLLSDAVIDRLQGYLNYKKKFNIIEILAFFCRVLALILVKNFEVYLTNRPQFSMVYTLIDRRNDVIKCSKLR